MQTSQSDKFHPTVGPVSQTTNTSSSILQLTTENADSKRECNSCSQIPTYENILDNFCRANSGEFLKSNKAIKLH